MKNNLVAGVVLISALLIWSCSGETTIETEQIGQAEAPPETLDSAAYLQKGKEIAQATFKVLSSNLKQAMGNGGIPSAIAFCNINAQPLTDSLSAQYNVSIKRTSHKIRNPLNAPTAKEKIAIEYFQAGNKKAYLEENEDGSVSFYAPIPTKGLCVVCHGEVGKAISENDYNTVLEKYPKDQAIGFSVGELRGIWSIIFKPKNDE